MTEETHPSETTFVQEEVQLVNDLETLKVLSDALRLQIVEIAIDEPRTVKQMSKLLGTSTTKLYYHVNQLEEYQILKVVSTRIVSGVIEKQYRAAARAFHLSKSLVSLLYDEAGEGDSGRIDAILSPILDITREEIGRAMQSGLINLTEEDNPKSFPTILLRSLCRLNKEQAREFQNRLRALVTEFADCKPTPTDSEDEPGQPYGLVVAFYPISQPSSTDSED